MSKFCLIVIDGLGVAPDGPGNARTQAKTPTLDRLEKEVPNVFTEASGNAVGLPEGQQGASEPGHFTIGAGRIVWQPLELINREIKSGAFFENEVLVSACQRAKEKGVLHLFGIFSFGGVHGHIDHLLAMVDLAEKQGVETIYLHLIGDGRDVPIQRFCNDYETLKKKLKDHPTAKPASLVGRYYAMDRDKQYADRTKLAYDLYTQGDGEKVDDLCASAKEWYKKAPEREKTDYYIKPLKTPDFVPMKPDDTVIAVNFRTDRMYQIVGALEDEAFSEFDRPIRITDLVCMGPYSETLPVAYPEPDVNNTLGEVIANAGMKQLRIAETDKWAHMTFFFNGQREEPFPNEDWVLIDSPKVPNFAMAPEMSANELTDTTIEKVKEGTYDFIAINYANPDLVGHGADVDAAVVACETVDRNIGRLLPVLDENGYDWIVTADHGNIEDMIMPSGEISPAHTAHPVRTYVHSEKYPEGSLKKDMGLKDIAPMCLTILGIDVPEEMQAA